MPKDISEIILEELRILQDGFGKFATTTNNRLSNVENDIADLAQHVEAVPALQELVKRHDSILLNEAAAKKVKKNFWLPIGQTLVSSAAGAAFFWLITTGYKLFGFLNKL